MSRSEKQGRRHRLWALAGAGILSEVGGIWLRTGRLGGNVIVRCRQGHLFTTIWIPTASVKSLRFGWWRLQYCPVGRHWTIVSPAKESDLSEAERRTAREHRDVRVP